MPPMLIEPEYGLGDFVYYKTDPDQAKLIVTELRISPDDILYRVSCGTSTYSAYAIELSSEPDLALKTGLDNKAEGSDAG